MEMWLRAMLADDNLKKIDKFCLGVLSQMATDKGMQRSSSDSGWSDSMLGIFGQILASLHHWCGLAPLGYSTVEFKKKHQRGKNFRNLSR